MFFWKVEHEELALILRLFAHFLSPPLQVSYVPARMFKHSKNILKVKRYEQFYLC